LLFGGDCHGLNIAVDLILTSVNAMVSGDDSVNFIANLEKFYWLIGAVIERKDLDLIVALCCLLDSLFTQEDKK
jgi:hypothetical protein